jgi:hypothetical protein
LKRGLSKASIDCPLLRQLRRQVLKNVLVPISGPEEQNEQGAEGEGEEEDEEEDEESFAEDITSTFALPNLMQYPEAFKAFLLKDLVEMSTLVSLEQGGWFAALKCRCFFRSRWFNEHHKTIHAVVIVTAAVLLAAIIIIICAQKNRTDARV